MPNFGEMSLMFLMVKLLPIFCDFCCFSRSIEAGYELYFVFRVGFAAEAITKFVTEKTAVQVCRQHNNNNTDNNNAKFYKAP